MATTTRTSSMRHRELGRRLREAQEKVGLRGLDIAERLGWTQSTVSRTVNGYRTISEADAAVFLAACDVTGQERERLAQMAEPADDPHYLRLAMDDQWCAYLGHANEAVRLTEWQPAILPWLLQIPAYAQAVLEGEMRSETELADEIVTRHQAVTLTRLPNVEILIHEWVLRTPVANSLVMSEQLHYLLRLSVEPSLSVRVVPIGRGAGLVHHGAFSLLEFADTQPIVYGEGLVEGTFIDDKRHVSTYRKYLGILRRAALNEWQSRELIAELADGYSSSAGLTAFELSLEEQAI